MKIDSPIGIFDSGVGGLTVASEIMKILPQEDIIYFGDVARTPYGSKSQEVVRKFAAEITSFLVEQGVKMIVVACNTAAAVALSALQEKFKLPIIGVIQPGVKKAIASTPGKKIGVIGTQATIGSGAYAAGIKQIDSTIQVMSQPCPLFVPLVEEGWIDHQVTRLVAEEYLAPLRDNGVDALILGCTHYPFLKAVLQEVMGERVVLVDSAVEVARETKRILEVNGLCRTKNPKAKTKFYLSDVSSKFIELGEKLLGKKMRVVTQVDVSGRTI